MTQTARINADLPDLADAAAYRYRLVHHGQQRENLLPRLGALGGEQHTVALYAAERRVLEGAEDDDLFALQLFGLVELPDACLLYTSFSASVISDTRSPIRVRIAVWI